MVNEGLTEAKKRDAQRVHNLCTGRTPMRCILRGMGRLPILRGLIEGWILTRGYHPFIESQKDLTDEKKLEDSGLFSSERSSNSRSSSF